MTLSPASDRSTTDAEAPGDPSGRSVQSATNVRPSAVDDTPALIDIERLARAMDAFYGKQPGTMLFAARTIAATYVRDAS